MVTVAIIAILSAIAIPAYTDYVKRGKIPDATSTLSTKRVKLEQWFQDNRSYVTDTTDCATDSASSQNFTFTCAATATTYTLTATGKNAMLGFTYTLDQSGAKTTTIGTGAPSGWTVASPNNCWVTRKGGVC